MPDDQAVSTDASEAAATAGRVTTPRKPHRITPHRELNRPTLNNLDERLLELMVWGIERPLPHYPEIAPGYPLSAQQAGDMLRLRRKYVRDLMMTPTWQREMTAAVNRLRNGEVARSWHTIIAIRDEPGDNQAADRTVRLKAAQTLLGEQAKGATVNVQVNSQTNVTAGYVLDLRPEQQASKTIDGTAEEASE